MLVNGNRLFVSLYLSPNKEEPERYVAPFNPLTERRIFKESAQRRASSRFD